MPGEGQSVANETEEAPRPSVSGMEKLKREDLFVSLFEHFFVVFHAIWLNGLGFV